MAAAVCAVATSLVWAQDDPLGYWSGIVEREGKTWRVAIRITQVGGGRKAFADFIDADGYDRELSMREANGLIRLERSQPSGIPIVFEGRVVDDVFSGDWSGFGQKAVFKLSRTVAPENAFREKEVSFKNGAVVLSGTVLLPPKGERVPAVAITHGGTPNERAAYRSWALHFVRRGIAALIYDKRGSGKSGGETRSASMEDLAGDAVAGVELLRTLPEIDAGKVGVAGHSQGGWIAPLAATMSPRVSFVIASAASGVGPDKQSIYHRASVMRESGFSAEEIKTASDLRRRLYQTGRMILDKDPRASEERQKISAELARYAAEPWIEAAALPPNLDNDRPTTGGLRLLFFDPVPMWEKVKVPVLLAWGDKDTVVPVAEGRAIIEAALQRSGNRNVSVKIFADVDHGVVKVRNDKSWDFPRVDLDYYSAIAAWASKIARA